MIVSLADDDPKFRQHVEKWSRNRDLSNKIELHAFDSPNSLLKFLHSNCRKPERKILVLLDLDFHGDRERGLKTLTTIRKNKGSLRKVPVVIYTNTRDSAEIDKSYLRLANSFVWKGYGGKQRKRFTELILFWKSLAALPHVGLPSP
jgi:CheY-like chemotaxis protein